MSIYITKSNRLNGTKYNSLFRITFNLFKQIKRQTKRRPYLRSAYFKKDKIFLDIFWKHLHEKNWRDRVRRMRFFPSAIELIRNSRFHPISKDNPNKSSEILHRFEGMTADKYFFAVQIKEGKRSGQKYFISVYPRNK